MAKRPVPHQGPIQAELHTGSILKAMRQALGLSQERFAELVGMKRQQLSAYETGLHTPGVDKLATIAKRAGIEVNVTVGRQTSADSSRQSPGQA